MRRTRKSAGLLAWRNGGIVYSTFQLDLDLFFCINHCLFWESLSCSEVASFHMLGLEFEHHILLCCFTPSRWDVNVQLVSPCLSLPLSSPADGEWLDQAGCASQGRGHRKVKMVPCGTSWIATTTHNHFFCVFVVIEKLHGKTKLANSVGARFRGARPRLRR